MYLLHGHCMDNARLNNLNVKTSCGTDRAAEGVTFERRDGEGCRFVQRLGFDLDAVGRPVRLGQRHQAGMHRHGRKS